MDKKCLTSVSPELILPESHDPLAGDPVCSLYLAETEFSVIYDNEWAHDMRDHIEICALAEVHRRKGRSDFYHDFITKSTCFWRTEGYKLNSEHQASIKEAIEMQADYLMSTESTVPNQEAIHSALSTNANMLQFLDLTFLQEDNFICKTPNLTLLHRLRDQVVLAMNYQFDRNCGYISSAQFDATIEKTSMAINYVYAGQEFNWRQPLSDFMEVMAELSERLKTPSPSHSDDLAL